MPQASDLKKLADDAVKEIAAAADDAALEAARVRYLSRKDGLVTAATLTLDNGAEVTATVENGWAVAWWPGAHHLASAQLTTPSGPQTQTFLSYPCDVHNCNGGGPHGGAPGGGPSGG